jgi:hypothetical protein
MNASVDLLMIQFEIWIRVVLVVASDHKHLFPVGCAVMQKATVTRVSVLAIATHHSDIARQCEIRSRRSQDLVEVDLAGRKAFQVEVGSSLQRSGSSCGYSNEAALLLP